MAKKLDSSVTYKRSAIDSIVSAAVFSEIIEAVLPGSTCTDSKITGPNIEDADGHSSFGGGGAGGGL
jgi:hypothetical protein